MMSEHVQRQSTLLDVAEHAGGFSSKIKGLVDFFIIEVPGTYNLKYLTNMKLFQATNYTREAYLNVSLLLSCDCRIFENIIEDKGNKYAMDQDNYPRTLPKMQNLPNNWRHNDRTILRPPLGGLYFSQD